MSGWNEDNFLEKMMPLLEKKHDGAGVCPSAETLCAAADGAAAQPLREAVETHAAQCPACADLLRRVREFRPVPSPVIEREWRQAEPRLNGQMREFLGRRAKAPWWQLGWMLAPVAAAAALILVMHKAPPASVPARVATNVVAPPPGVVQEKPAPGIANLSASEQRTDPVPVPAPMSAPQTPPPAETAQTKPAPEPAPVETAAAPAAEAAPAHSLSGGFAPVLATAGGQAPQSAPPPPPPAPASVHIDAGTRVWILLQSTSPESNGGFTFKGMVLLPVTQGGAVLLDRETRVVGTGKVNQGRTTIRIAEFVWHGKRYRLRGAPVAIHAPGPGAGPAVEFNAGQVLETWLASPSIYEKVAAPQG